MRKVILAKRFGNTGSMVLYIDDGEILNTLFDYLTDESIGTDVQIVSVKGIENYREYYPLTEYTDSKKFTIDVLKMMQ